MESNHLTYTEKRLKGQKVEIQKSLFEKEGDQWRLVDQNRYVEARLFLSFASQLLNQAPKIVINAAITFLATIITKQNPNTVLLAGLYFTVSKVERALAERVSDIRRRISSQPITVINPSNLAPFSVGLGQLVTVPIDLLSTYQLADPSLNIDLTIQQSNGLPAPAWINLGMGPVTTSSILNLENELPQVLTVSGPYAYVVASNFNNSSLVKIDTRTKSVVWSQLITVPLSSYDLFVQGDLVLYCGYNSTSFEVQAFNATTALKLDSVVTSIGNWEVVGIALAENSILFASAFYQGLFYNNLTSINFINPVNMVVNNPISLGYDYPNEGDSLYVQGDVLYNSVQQGVNIFNITSEKEITLLGSIDVPEGAVSTTANDQTLFVSTNNGNLLVYNKSPVAAPVFLNSNFIGASDGNMFVDGSFLYMGGGFIIDISDLQNTFVTATFQSSFNDMPALVGNQIILLNSGIMFIDASKRTLTVTRPSIADRGLWFFNVTATDNAGHSLVTQIPVHVGDISVPVVSDQVVYVGASTIVTVAPFEFPNANFTYTVSTLPHFIQFSVETLEFTIAPKTGHQGTYPITLTGDDGYTGVAFVSFNVIVPNRFPLFAKPLVNQTWYTNKYSRYNLSGGTVIDPDGDPLIYKGNLLGSTLLPQWISSDETTGDFFGVAPARNKYAFQLTAQDSFGGSATSAFEITAPNTPPDQINVIPNLRANVNEPFTYAINSNTVTDIDGDPLTYAVQSLPSFLSFNNVTRSVSGTPTPQTANGITTKPYTVELLVSDGQGGSLVVKMVVDVSGTTYWSSVALGVFYGATGLYTAYEFWKKRDVYLNYILGPEHKQEKPEMALVGEKYTHELKLKRNEVKRLIVLYNGFPLPPEKPFPDGLEYKNNSLQGVPTDKNTGYFTVRVIKNSGRYSEEFSLIIKKTGDPDPENGKPKNHLSYLKEKILNLRNRSNNKSSNLIPLKELSYE